MIMPSARNIGPAAMSLLLTCLPAIEGQMMTRSNATSVALTCQTFYDSYPELTYFSNATAYTTVNECMNHICQRLQRLSGIN